MGLVAARTALSDLGRALGAAYGRAAAVRRAQHGYRRCGAQDHERASREAGQSGRQMEEIRSPHADHAQTTKEHPRRALTERVDAVAARRAMRRRADRSRVCGATHGATSGGQDVAPVSGRHPPPNRGAVVVPIKVQEMQRLLLAHAATFAAAWNCARPIARMAPGSRTPRHTPPPHV